MKVWALHLETSEGHVVFAFWSEDALIKYLFEYVSEWWERELPEGGPIPDDPREAINDYFDYVDGEDYTYDYVDVEPVGDPIEIDMIRKKLEGWLS